MPLVFVVVFLRASIVRARGALDGGGDDVAALGHLARYFSSVRHVPTHVAAAPAYVCATCAVYSLAVAFPLDGNAWSAFPTITGGVAMALISAAMGALAGLGGDPAGGVRLYVAGAGATLLWFVPPRFWASRFASASRPDPVRRISHPSSPPSLSPSRAACSSARASADSRDSPRTWYSPPSRSAPRPVSRCAWRNDWASTPRWSRRGARSRERRDSPRGERPWTRSACGEPRREASRRGCRVTPRGPRRCRGGEDEAAAVSGVAFAASGVFAVVLLEAPAFRAALLAVAGAPPA